MPTATHDDAVTHDTEYNSLSSLPMLGLSATDQIVPFHDNDNV